MKNRVFLFLIIVPISFLFCSSSYGNAIFKVSISQPMIQVDDTATISVWAKIEEQTSGLNGIDTWQCDLVVGADQGGVVEVIDVEILAPLPRNQMIAPYASVNSPLVGNVFGLGAVSAIPGSDSSVGVGDFSLLANVMVKAISLGTAEYSIADISGIGFYVYLKDFYTGGNDYDARYAEPYKAVFEVGNNVINVVPEPATILLFGAAGLILRKRQ